MRATCTAAARARQHLNPFAGALATLRATPADLDWATQFAQPAQPIHLDLGCGSGRYLQEVAARDPSTNFVGVEIRGEMVARARRRQRRHWAAAPGAGADGDHDADDDRTSFLREALKSNLVFLHVNILAPGALEGILRSMTQPKGSSSSNSSRRSSSKSAMLRSVSIFHPDPNFKKRRKKRAVVNQATVDLLARTLVPGTRVHLQSDVEEVYLSMEQEFLRARVETAAGATAGAFRRVSVGGAEDPNALGLPTDRERLVLEHGGQVWRGSFVVSS